MSRGLSTLEILVRLGAEPTVSRKPNIALKAPSAGGTFGAWAQRVERTASGSGLHRRPPDPQGSLSVSGGQITHRA